MTRAILIVASLFAAFVATGWRTVSDATRAACRGDQQPKRSGMTSPHHSQPDIEQATMENLGRFGHHPDPAIDFCVEVEELEGMACNRRVGFDPEPTLDARIERAMQFRVGGDLGAISAKATLREIEGQTRP